MEACTMNDTTILTCGHVPSPHPEFTTGYGSDAERNTYCYECCAQRERQSMIETGSATLYLVKRPVPDSVRPVSEAWQWWVTDWPGTLAFQAVALHKGRHNIARVRYDFSFRGPDGFWWRGTSYGDNTQIAHCRRTKERTLLAG